MSDRRRDLFLDFCERAHCPPDFPAVYGMGETAAASWLSDRLRRYGHDIPDDQVRAAVAGWQQRPPDDGVMTGT